ALNPRPILIDTLDCFLGDCADRPRVAAQRGSVIHVSGYTAEPEYTADAANPVGAAAKSEQINAIPGTPLVNDLSITIDDILGDAQPGRLAHEISAPSDPADLYAIVIRRRSQTWVVESHLGVGINGGIWSAASRAGQLVDIAAPLVWEQPSRLASPIREDKDVPGALCCSDLDLGLRNHRVPSVQVGPHRVACRFLRM